MMVMNLTDHGADYGSLWRVKRIEDRARKLRGHRLRRRIRAQEETHNALVSLLMARKGTK
jgi:hypothetical protein